MHNESYLLLLLEPWPGEVKPRRPQVVIQIINRGLVVLHHSEFLLTMLPCRPPELWEGTWITGSRAEGFPLCHVDTSWRLKAFISWSGILFVGRILFFFWLFLVTNMSTTPAFVPF